MVRIKRKKRLEIKVRNIFLQHRIQQIICNDDDDTHDNDDNAHANNEDTNHDHDAIIAAAVVLQMLLSPAVIDTDA